MESNMVVGPRTREKLRVMHDSDGPLLAVAIAATLVEYQRYAVQRTGQKDPDITRANWKTVVRLEQLRGRG